MINGQQAQPDGRLEVSVKLAVNTWNMILSLIAKGPWDQANPLIEELHRQIRPQVEAANEAKGDPPPASPAVR